MKPVVTTVTVLLVNLAFQTSIAAPSYVTLKVSDLAMLVGGTIDSRVLHYLWLHQGLWCNSLYIVPCANRLSWPLPDFHRVCKYLPVGQFYNMEDSVS